MVEYKKWSEHLGSDVVYFDQQTHANDEKSTFSIMRTRGKCKAHKELFSSCVSHEPLVRMMEKVLFYHFQCFSSFSTMLTHAQAWVRCLKYTTVRILKNYQIYFKVLFLTLGSGQIWFGDPSSALEIHRGPAIF